MRLSTGRWVSGDDFFNRERELRQLETLVRDRNHVLLTGQRRMGKTSVARELGQRLKAKDWIFLFADVEGATCAEDAIAGIAQEIYSVRPIMSRVARAGNHDETLVRHCRGGRRTRVSREVPSRSECRELAASRRKAASALCRAKKTGAPRHRRVTYPSQANA